MGNNGEIGGNWEGKLGRSHIYSESANAYVRNNPLSNVDRSGKQGNPVGATCTWDATFQSQSCSGQPNNLQFPGCAGCSWTAPPTGLSNQATLVNGFGGEGAAGEQQYLQNVRDVIGWVAGDDPLSVLSMYPQDSSPKESQSCDAQILNAVNATFGTTFSAANVGTGPNAPFQYSVGALSGQGTLNIDIFPASGQGTGISAGRYPLNWLTYIVGYGTTLHIPPGPGGADSPQTLRASASQFTAHLDSSYPYNPIGLAIHLLSMTGTGGYAPCPQ